MIKVNGRRVSVDFKSVRFNISHPLRREKQSVLLRRFRSSLVEPFELFRMTPNPPTPVFHVFFGKKRFYNALNVACNSNSSNDNEKRQQQQAVARLLFCRQPNRVLKESRPDGERKTDKNHESKCKCTFQPMAFFQDTKYVYNFRLCIHSHTHTHTYWLTRFDWLI